MKRRPVREAHRLERELRARVTSVEYNALVRQLSGAVAAIDLLSVKAPAFLDHFLESSELVRTDSITEQARAALTDLVDELRGNSARGHHLPLPTSKPRQAKASLSVVTPQARRKHR